MIEVPILLKRLQRQLPIHLIQLPIQRPHKLHTSNRPQQLSRRMIHALVLGSQPDAEIAEAELDIAGCSELVRFAHGLGLRWRKRRLKQLDFLEEDDDLVRCEAFDVGWGRFVRWGRPGFREGVAAVDHAGVEFGLGWEAGLVEPGVPVDGLEGFRGGGIRGEEIEESGFEVVGVEGFLGPLRNGVSVTSYKICVKRRTKYVSGEIRVPRQRGIRQIGLPQYVRL